MSPNQSRNSNTHNENGESKEKEGKKNESGLIQSLQVQYIEAQLKKNPSVYDEEFPDLGDFCSYLNNLENGKYEKDAFEILGGTKEQKELRSNTLKKISIQKTVSRKRFLQLLPKHFSKVYKLSDVENSIINTNLKSLTTSELKGLQSSEKDRVNFLLGKGKYKQVVENIVFKKDDEILSDLGISESRLDQFRRQHPEKAIAIVDYFRTTNPFSFVSELKIFLDFLNVGEKRELISSLFDSLPLKILEESGIISHSQSDKFISDAINEIDKKSTTKLTEIEKKSLIKSIDKSDFYIDVDLENMQSEVVEQLVNSEKFQEYLNKTIDEGKESMRKGSELVRRLNISEDKDSEEIFFDYIHESEKISPHIKSLTGKIKPGNVIKIQNPETKEPIFWEIEQTNVGQISETKAIKISDVTYKNNIRRSGVKKTESILYDRFFQLLEANSKIIENSKNLPATDIFDIYTDETLKEEKIVDLKEESEIQTKEELQTYLNEKDSKNTNVKLDKMSFFVGSGDNKGTAFTVTLHEGSEKPIVLDTGESYTYSEFLQGFDENDCERFESVSTPEELLKNIVDCNSEVSKLYKGLEFRDGKFMKKISKEGESDEYITYDYFVSEDKNSTDSVYVDSFESNSFYTGKYIKADKEDKKSKNKKDEYKSEGKTSNLSDIYHLITKRGLVPYSAEENVKAVHEENSEDFKRTKSGFKAFLKGASVAELFNALKIGYDAVEQKLTTGNKLKSARLAMSIAKGIGGKDSALYTEMQQIVEAENKKQMEDIVGQLTTLDSDIMLRKILRIIECKDSEEYEKEAALMTIVKKYGVLYPKHATARDGDEKGLCHRRNEWMWYKAFGGKVNDPLFLKIKAECEGTGKDGNPPTPFTEEVLMEKLLREQKEPPYSRRSKLHKDYGGALKGGIADELKDGGDKTSDMVTLEGRVSFAIGQFKGGELNSGVGTLDNIFAKNGSAVITNEVPFAITITNIAANMDQGLLGKELVGKGFVTPYTSLFFNHNPSIRSNYYDAVYEMVKDFGDEEMTQAFETIKKNSGTKGIEKASIFWKEYGSRLFPRLQCQDGWVASHAKTEVKKDDPDYKKKIEKQKIYAEYYETFTGFTNDNQYEIKEEHIGDGRHDISNASISVGAMPRIVKQHFKVNVDGKIGKNQRRILEQALIGLKDIGKKTDLTDEQKKTVFMEVFPYMWAMAQEQYEGKDRGDSFKDVLLDAGINAFGDDIGFQKDRPDVKKDPNYNTYSNDLSREMPPYFETEAYKKFCDKKADDFISSNKPGTEVIEYERIGVSSLTDRIITVGNQIKPANDEN
ncbi:MAG: hypothetical protein GY828_00425 [Candidatus Gracilibacteria bacterium]|nr:hypothetical protein [Candidatus Gracilibacteria bacterium]